MAFRPGNICHLEIPAPDIPKLKAFYAVVFGWSFAPMHEGYECFDAGNIAGALASHLEPSQHGSLITVMCEDVSASLQRAIEAGGRVLQPATKVPGGRGSYGYFADPCGNKVGVWME
ncbi:MAG: VOC family protein [Planctomycetes bacterium]|nr:VOC family protein [Planctomycetota bacterium]